MMNGSQNEIKERGERKEEKIQLIFKLLFCFSLSSFFLIEKLFFFLLILCLNTKAQEEGKNTKIKFSSALSSKSVIQIEMETEPNEKEKSAFLSPTTRGD
jgi:hypothetical protein